MKRSPTAMTCCAKPCGTRGRPNASASRSTVRREHRADQRREPAHHHRQQHRRDDQVGDDDAHDAAAEADDQHQPQDERRGRARERQQAELARLLPHAQHVERDEREADREGVQQHQLQRHACSRERRAASASEGAAATDATRRTPFDRQQEEEERARQPLPCRRVLAVVPEAHERAVDAPAEEQLGDGLDAAEQRERRRSPPSSRYWT